MLEKKLVISAPNIRQAKYINTILLKQISCGKKCQLFVKRVIFPFLIELSFVAFI